MRALTIKDLADLDIESGDEARSYDEALVEFLNASLALAANRVPCRPVTDVVPKSVPDLTELLRELTRNFRGGM